LVGSTALSARLELRAVIGAYHRCVAAVIERGGGFVAKYMGDGVLAYYGYPRADEHDAESGVRAGLALVDAAARLDTAAGVPLQVRVGIGTGLVVVGDLIGAGAAQEQAVVGETPNLAARLQALAEPNAIVIAESTRRQIGGLFEVADLGPQPLRGFPEPQRAWRVIAEKRGLGRFEALRSGAKPLVGRAEELDLLLRRWTQAKAGNGRVVLICGEPGVGKSRLTEALAERIAGEPQIRLRYFCSPHHQDSAYIRSSRRRSAPPVSRATMRPGQNSPSCERCWLPRRRWSKTWRCSPSCMGCRPPTSRRRSMSRRRSKRRRR
jgi:class 3 adenylate cyclase